MNINTEITPGGVPGTHNAQHSVLNMPIHSESRDQPQAHALQTEVVGGELIHDAGLIDTSALTSVIENANERVIRQTMPNHPLEDMLTRFVKINTYDLSATAAPLSVLASFDPWAQFQAIPAVASKLANYYLIRADLELLIVSAFPPASYGSWEVTALPYGGQTTGPAGNQTSFVPDATQCRAADVHAEILATSGNDVCLTLPFYWPYDFAALKSGGGAGGNTGLTNSWNVYITTLAELSTAIPGGIVSGSISIYARMKPGYILTIPSLQGGPLDKPISSGLAKAADTLTSMAKIPVIGAYAQAASSLATVASTVASALGHSREPEDVRPVPVQAIPLPPLSHASGRTLVNEANLLPGVYLDPKMDVERTDIAAFEDIARRPFVYNVLTWSAAEDSGAALTTIPVTPFLVSPTSVLGQFHIAPAGYVGLPFDFWRADAVVEVEVVCSSFHRGTLQAYWTPWNYTAPSTDDPTNVTVNHIWDVQPGIRKQFRIGFARANPYAKVVPLVSSQLASGAALDTVCNGFFSLRVVNPLQSQVSSATVSLIISVRWENVDFRELPTVLETPAFGSPATVRTNPFMTYLSLQGMGDADIAAQDVIDLVPATLPFPGDGLCFPGLGVSSCRAMVQKPSLIPQVKLTELIANSGLYGTYIAYPPSSQSWLNALDPSVSYIPYVLTYAEYYTAPFSWASSVCLQAYMNQSALIGYEMSTQNTQVADINVPSPLNPITIMASTGGYQVQLPYKNYAKFVNGNIHNYLNGNPMFMELFTSSLGTLQAGAYTALYYHLASDVRFTRYIQIPLVTFNANSWTATGVAFPTSGVS